MKKTLIGIVLTISMVMTILPTVALGNGLNTKPKALDNTTQEEWDVLRYTNIERAKAGLPLLITFDRMQKMAGVRSDELVQAFSHTRPDGQDPSTVFKEYGFKSNSFAENIAWGQASAKEVVADWMKSEGHRMNILTQSLRYMGSGFTNKNKKYWVQIFAGSSVLSESVTYYEDLGYFKIELKNGITAYAPYDPISSPTVDGKVTFNYPGADYKKPDTAQEDTTQEDTTNKEISILAYPSKTAYRVGEAFDITGFNAVSYDGGKEENINDKITFYTSKTVKLTQGRKFTTSGAKVVELRYNGEKIDEYTIVVTNEEVIAKAKHPFTDVVTGSYYENPVIWALKSSITGGTSQTTFAPNDTCTRAQVATFLWRAKGSPEPKLLYNPFTDITPDDYFYKAVLWAVEKGITSGTSQNAFSPHDTCTSGQVVTFLWRSNNKPVTKSRGTLAEKYRGQYYSEAVAWAEGKGLLSGTGTNFVPDNNSSRADIVTYLYRNAGSPDIKQ